MGFLKLYYLLVIFFSDHYFVRGQSHKDPCPKGQCDPSLSCVEGFCICPNEDKTFSKWDIPSKTCLIFAEAECEYPQTNLTTPCIPLARCVRNGTTGQCKCLNGLKPNSKGICVIGYGEKCEVKNDLCDNSIFLKCGGENRCICQNGIVYDKIRVGHTCSILPGASCRVSEGPECITGTTCNDSVCKCPGNSRPNKKDPSKCILNHSENCYYGPLPNPPICDPIQNLECINGSPYPKCKCIGENTTSIYDHETGRCFQLAGAKCDPAKDSKNVCIQSATCRFDNGNNVCKCNSQLITSTEDGKCYLGHGQKCIKENNFCNPFKFLECNQTGYCGCGDGSIYSQIEDNCLLLPEINCDLTAGSQLCVPTAPCQLSIDPSKSSTCLCPNQSKVSKYNSSLCILSYNDPCTITEEDLCDPFSHLKCDPLGVCKCKEGTYYDEDTDQCFILANEPCNNSIDFITQNSCTPNSICLLTSGIEKCQCKKGFIPNRYSQCYLPFNSTCSIKNNLCDPSSFLYCDLGNKCSCQDNALYNHFTKRCELFAGSACIPNIGVGTEQPCIQNSTCSETERKCICNGNFVGNAENLCFLNHGSPCYPNIDEDMCDALQQIHCDLTTNQCICQDEYEGGSYYNGFLKKCTLLAGTPCFVNASLCTPNAICDPIDHICTCSKGTVPNDNGYCFLPYSSPCQIENDLCDPHAFLECNRETNSCQCKRGFETVYDPIEKTCRLIHDRPCESNPRSQKCDPNAMCTIVDPGINFTRCKCIDGFNPNKEQLCYLGYKESCSSLEKENKCDPDGHLICKFDSDLGQICTCPSNNNTYSSERQECLINPKETCDPSPDSQKCVDNAFCSSERSCVCQPGFEATVTGGQCLLNYGSLCPPLVVGGQCNDQSNLECLGGICACKPGYIELKTNLLDDNPEVFRTICVPGYGVTCDEIQGIPGLDCNPKGFLSCWNSQCLCTFPEQQIYLENISECRSTVGMMCDSTSRICVPRAECVNENINAPLRGICKCDKNSTTSAFNRKECFEKSGSTLIYPIYSYTFIMIFALLNY